ncbi:hypothetical protein [Methylobacterium nonmethylotrophicum]|uniref:Fimbrial assembly protein n=1 Tax=Methylobacterium nonmethylotrophicum TaxID=1141884 RepID=A0A4Z0NUQ4_9HYPH|nr:hypothetical protein [Methylobacterium nonmethylotrophicum]TGE01041.1 hypothetical protein EU555_05385 [Methylobacterium nonmethylotrophicum]
MELTSSAGMQRRVRTMVGASERLLHLWLEDLLSFLSPSLRRSLAELGGSKPPPTILCDQDAIVADDPTVSLDRLLARSRSELVILKIDQKHVLRRRLEVPGAVIASLDAALSMNIGVWTPFATEEVYAAARQTDSVAAAGSQTSSVPIEVRCVSRTLVDRHIHAARALGIEPDAVQLGDRNFVVIRETKKRRVWRWQRRMLIALIVACAVQVVGFSALITATQSTEIERLFAEQTSLKQSLRRSAQAEKQTARQVAILNKVASSMDESRSVSKIMQTLARALPAGTVVLELEISRDRGEGHVAVSGPKDLDLVAALASTMMYRARDLAATSSTDEVRRTYAVGFTLTGWETGASGTIP